MMPPALGRASVLQDVDRQHRLEVLGEEAAWDVLRWWGWERVSSGFGYAVEVLSPEAGLDIQSWLGRPARLLTRLADGSAFPRSGCVVSAEALGSEGGLACYRLILAPWLWALTQGRHSRVFQTRTLLEIIDAVLEDYSTLAHWRLSDEVGPFLAEVPPRSFCMQYRESDFAFLARLLAEEGIGWRFEADADAPCGHSWVLFASSASQPEEQLSLQQGGVRFHRSDATEHSDTLQVLGRHQRLYSHQLSLPHFDYKGGGGQGQTHRLPLLGAVELPMRLEVYAPAGIYPASSPEQAERYLRLMAEAREAQACQWQGEGSVRSFRAGDWFRLRQWPGSDAPEALWLGEVLHLGCNDLPVDVASHWQKVRSRVPEWAVLSITVPDASSCAWLQQTGHWERLWSQAQAVGYANRFGAVPRDCPWRPMLQDGTGALLNPRPLAPGLQTAIVTGPDGQLAAEGAHEVHTDALGRVRVRFHFQAGERRDDRDSCWLRVAQRYAGPGVGSQFLPRIGQEVLVAFQEGDIDRPVIVGSLYNGQGEAGIPPTPGGRGEADIQRALYAQARDAQPSAQGNLAGGHAPAWHGLGAGEDAHRNATALWGIQSKEWGGSGYNRVVFDDSDGQLRLQLASSHGHSQLNFGHLIHQADNYRGSFRGEGFELRTDAWGSVRAESGLWLSAQSHDWEAPAGEHIPEWAQLKYSAQLAAHYSALARTHLTAALGSHEGVQQARHSRLIADRPPLEALWQSARTVVSGQSLEVGQSEAKARNPAPGEGRVPESGDALLGLSAPAGIGLLSGQSLHTQAQESLSLISGGDAQLSSAEHTRVLASQALGWSSGIVAGAVAEGAPGLQLASAKGEVKIQAQNASIALRSREQLKVVSVNAEAELAAGKRIELTTAGGASITLEGGHIHITCPGEIKVHASQKEFLGPARQPYPLPLFPTSVCVSCLQKALQNGHVMATKNG